MTAIWSLAGQESRRYAAMVKDLKVEVAIVGGGVTGLSTAIRLLEEGRKVAVLEALQVQWGQLQEKLEKAGRDREQFKAVRKLQQPSRSQELVGFLD